MPKFSRRTKLITAFVIIVIVAFGIFEFFRSESNGVPQDFTDARSQGAVISENIVNISNQSTDQLEQVNQLDEQGNYTEALTITTNLVTNSQDLRNQAVSLSAQVQQMTNSISGISSEAAQQDALEAISSELSLITQLVNYSNDLDNLLTALEDRFTGKGGSSAQIQSLVAQVNTDVNAINTDNTAATQQLNNFDKIEGK